MSRSNLIWIFGSVLIAFVFSLVFGHAPVEMRRVGLFFLIFGGLTGSLLGWLTREVSDGLLVKWQVLVVALLIGVGSLHVSWLSYTSFRQVRERELQQNPQQLAILKMFEESTEDALFAEQYDKVRRQWQPEFQDYLQFRLSGIRELPSPWPESIWGLELLASVICGCWVFCKVVPSHKNSRESFSEEEKAIE